MLDCIGANHWWQKLLFNSRLAFCIPIPACQSCRVFAVAEIAGACALALTSLLPHVIADCNLILYHQSMASDAATGNRMHTDPANVQRAKGSNDRTHKTRKVSVFTQVNNKKELFMLEVVTVLVCKV